MFRPSPSSAAAPVRPPLPDLLPGSSRILLPLLVFAGGFGSVGFELAASRLVAPYFGSSTFIWATLIGVTLAFLSLGYAIGGRLADRRPSFTLLCLLITLAAVAGAIVPLLARPILLASLGAFQRVDAGAFYGALIAILLLLAVPVTLLGAVTPFAIRLRLHGVAAAGRTAGGVYALSTIGSIAGSFLPVLLLIPLVGTAWTFFLLSLSLLLPALLGLAAARALLPATVAAAAALLLPFAAAAADRGFARPPESGRLLYEGESPYNYIQVVEDDGRVLLYLDDGHAIHSVYDPDADDLLTGGPWDGFMVAPLVVRDTGPDSIRSALLIGLAGGTVARQLTAAYGPIPIAGVEIDPEVAAVGRRYFGLESLPNLDLIVADGRYALRTIDGHYDLIGIDAYRQPYIPFQLTSREFFAEVAGRLTPSGVAVVNAGRTSTDYRLVEVLASTMRDVFGHVYVFDVEGYGNSLIVGTNAPSAVSALAANLAAFPPDSPVAAAGARVAASGNLRAVPAGGRVFTDDLAPVEWVVDQMILDAAREGGAP